MARGIDGVLPAARRSELLKFVQARGHATVSELVARFEVSADTVRRDLDQLSEQGLVSRTHGGAVAAEDRAAQIQPLQRRAHEHTEAKRAIGKLAASLVADDETIMIGGGSTSLEVARALSGRRRVTVVTNNLLVPVEMPPEAYREMWVVGGQLREGALSTFGGLQLPGIRRLSADRTFVGVSGVSAQGYFSVAAPGDGAIVGEMLRSARVSVVVADSSKFDHDAFAQCASFDEVDVLVTDRRPAEPIAAALRDAGVEVLVAQA